MTSDPPQKPDPIREPEPETLDESFQEEVVVETEAMEPAPRQRSAKEYQSIRNLWIVIGGLTFLLIISMLFNQAPERATVPADDPDVAAMRADLEMRRAELNRQRAELNLPPIAGRGEDLETITARLRKDADTLVSLIERSQQLVAEKDRLLTEKNVELIRSERIRESLTSELARSQTNPDDTARLRNDLSDALARANRLADELAGARELIEELSEDTSAAEIETLTRRLDEVTRARDFFELRAQQLEATRQNGRDEVSDEDEE